MPSLAVSLLLLGCSGLLVLQVVSADFKDQQVIGTGDLHEDGSSVQLKSEPPVHRTKRFADPLLMGLATGAGTVITAEAIKEPVKAIHRVGDSIANVFGW